MPALILIPVVILLLCIWFIRSNTVEGWEDETGFHFGHNPKDDV